MNFWPDCFYYAVAFLSGSIPWSWLLGRFRGVDIRNAGSGNAGATNLFRVCGRGVGLVGLFLDALKGALPVLAAKHGIAGIAHPTDEWPLAVTAILAVIGHVFSLWFGFKGGKGVATTLGILLVLSPLTVAVGLVVFLLMLSITRYISLGSMTAAVAMIPSVFILEPGEFPVQIIISLVAILILVRHKSNIVRLLRGEENKFSFHGGNND